MFAAAGWAQGKIDPNAVTKDNDDIDYNDDIGYIDDVRFRAIQDSNKRGIKEIFINGIKQEGDLKVGKEIYEKKCVSCHGRKGDVVIFELQGKQYSLRTAKYLGFIREDMYLQIYNGLLNRANNPMPSYKNELSHNQIFSVILYIEYLSENQ
jgi:hypothetical protein